MKTIKVKLTMLLTITVAVAMLTSCGNSNKYLIYQSNDSNSGNHNIESRVYKGQMPELYVDGRQKTDNEYAIEYMPCINDNGVYAYALYNEYTSSSQILVEDTIIHEGIVCRTLYIDDDDLYFSDENMDSYQSYLWKYELKSGEKERLVVLESQFISKLIPDGRDGFLAEIWDSENNFRSVKKITIEGTIEDIPDISVGESWISEIDDGYYIECVNGNDNGRYLYNALYQYYSSQYGEPFSLSNDFAGRLSWNQSYRLIAMTELYDKTNSVIFRESIRQTTDNLLSVTNENINVQGDEVCPQLWATKKYSVDKISPRTDLVNNGCILYALMIAANSDVLDDDTKNEIIGKVDIAFDYFEKDYEEGHYSWEYGCSFPWDGLEMPWNQQNAFGMVLIEAYKVTGNGKYYSRVKEMIETFKREWIYKNDKLLWNYWPNSFYEGWEADEYVSVNNPSRGKTEGFTIEDSSHSAINAKFIYDYYKNFSNDNVVSYSDINALRNTLQGMCDTQGFLGYMGYISDDEYSFINSVGTWWIELENELLNDSYLCLGSSAYPDFDHQKLYAYAYNYDPEKPIYLSVCRYEIDDGEVKMKNTINIASQNDMIDYFEELYS